MKPFYEQRRPIWVYLQPNLDFPMHLHDALEIVYVLEGRSTVLHDTHRIPLEKGDLFVSFPNQVHGYTDTQDFLGFVIIITTKSLPAFQSILEKEQPAKPVLHPQGKGIDDLIKLMQIMHADRKTASAALLQGYAQVIFGKLLPWLKLIPRDRSGDALQQLLRYVNTHYTEPMTRAEIAKAVGYSESYISHLFTENMDISLTDYITLLRLDSARHRLRNTQEPIGQIALSLGFSSIRSFNRFFKQQMHTTPSAYRTQDA